MPAEAYYLVVINDDGNVTTYTKLPEELPAVTRDATTSDVYTSSRQIVEEFERAMLSNKVIGDLIQVLGPILAPEPEPTVSDKIREALKKRTEE